MNQSSLSISNVGKMNTSLHSGAGEAKALSDSEGSGSFLEALGAVFQSENEDGENVETSKLNAEQMDSASASVDELVESEVDDSSEKLSEETPEKQSIKGVDQSHLSGLEQEVTADSVLKSSADVEVNEKSDTALKQMPQQAIENISREPNSAAKVMSEGNELLERLDESKQALSKSSGKALPQTDPQVVEFTNQNIAAIKNDAENTENTENKVITAKAEQGVITENGKLVSVSENPLKNAAVESVDENSLQGQLSPLEISSVQKVELEGETSVKGLQEVTAEPVARQPNEAKLLNEALVWNSPDADNSALGAVQIKPQTNSLSPELEALDIAVSKSSIDSMPAGQLDKNMVSAVSSQGIIPEGELAEPSLEPQSLETQPAINWNTPLPEQDKAPIDAGKAVSGQVSSAATNVSQSVLTSQQHQANQLSQAQSQALVNDKSIPNMLNPAPSNEANVVPNQANSFNPVPIDAPQITQSQIAKGALASGSILAGSKALSNSKSDNKDAGLSQQLSGLASQQGAQQALKADLQQSISQSPLQLTRETVGEKMSEQVQMMMSKNLKNIDIRLDPPELGRMQIRMSMNNDMASVQFTVSNPQAREMVEQAMPRLREMLAQQGVQLSESSVQQQNSGQQQNQYMAGSDGSTSSNTRDSLGEDGVNLDESINLDLNIASKDDGISYYA